MRDITFECATRDDCLDLMVPSDLRILVSERDRLRDALKRIGDLDYTNAATNCAAYEAVCIARAALQGAGDE